MMFFSGEEKLLKTHSLANLSFHPAHQKPSLSHGLHHHMPSCRKKGIAPLSRKKVHDNNVKETRGKHLLCILIKLLAMANFSEKKKVGIPGRISICKLTAMSEMRKHKAILDQFCSSCKFFAETSKSSTKISRPT
jgi:hypothetical protein